MAPSDLAQPLEAGIGAVVVAAIKLAWSRMCKPGRQGVIDPLDRFGQAARIELADRVKPCARAS